MKRILTICVLAAAVCACAAVEPYEKESRVAEGNNRLDKAIFTVWRSRNLPPPAAASDCVMVRRLYLDLAGRIPSAEEAKAYVGDSSPDKKAKLIARLIDSDDFADYFAMRFCDVLRVKSEFPINLWPDAVYVYARRIRESVSENEPYADFVHALLIGSGSDFRCPEANFYRALAQRTPEGWAEVVALNFLGRHWQSLSGRERQQLSEFFRGIGCKKSREWKEEIVFYEPAAVERTLTFPDGKTGKVAKVEDARKVFADWLTSSENRAFYRAGAERVWSWFFGTGLVGGGDDVAAWQTHANRPILDVLTEEFAASRGDLKALCYRIANSAAYEATSLNPEQYEKAAAHFAVYPVRRIDAEVLDDAICDLSGAPRSYFSVIPEPFTYLPPTARSIRIEDGSIGNSFLSLLGRPARDTGLLEERGNVVKSSQLLYLFNSGELFRKLSRASRSDAVKSAKKYTQKIEALYWAFLSRPPTQDEWYDLVYEYNASQKNKNVARLFWPNLAWILLNSKEFIYRH